MKIVYMIIYTYNLKRFSQVCWRAGFDLWNIVLKLQFISRISIPLLYVVQRLERRKQTETEEVAAQNEVKLSLP
jgi:hypothetical protein